VAETFVGHAKGHDAEESEQEGPGTSDVPPAKDDAEVCCVPCKEHVLGSVTEKGVPSSTGRACHDDRGP
jgi:hypothetical protein